MSQIIHKLTLNSGSVNAAIYDATGSYILTGGKDKLVRLINATSGKTVHTYEGHGWEIQGVAISSTSQHVVCCGTSRAVTLWDINTSQTLRSFTGHTQKVDCISISAEGSIVVSGSFDKTVAVWDTRSSDRTPLQVLQDAQDGITSVHLGDSEMVAGSLDGSVRTYDLRMGRMTADALGQPVVSVRPVPGSQGDLLVGCMDSTVQILDRAEAKVSGTFTGHTCTQYRIQCDTNGLKVASGSEDGYVYVWDIAKTRKPGDYRNRLQGHSGVVNTVAFHPGAANDPNKQHSLLSAASDGTVILWGACGEARK
ncbi:hypothetical protein IW150_003860 [Coemansia sp. RSA 2607]|nr:hypothetical protein IW150_003860 [Coemansia sp. RSA 2607]